jgi:LAO/AO transport system kinase
MRNLFLSAVVLLVPESGDAVQTMKAGLMEIADIFVINKSDREGSDALGLALRTMIQLKQRKDKEFPIAVVKTVGTQNKGIDELYEAIIRHKQYLENNGQLLVKRRENLIKQMQDKFLK